MDAQPRAFDGRKLNVLDASAYPGRTVFRERFRNPSDASPGGAAADCLSQAHIRTALPSDVSKKRCNQQKGKGFEQKGCQVDFYPDGGLVQVKIPSGSGGGGGGIRGEVSGFSPQARRRMIQFTNKLRRDTLPWFITLTLPGRSKITHEQFLAAFHKLSIASARHQPEMSTLWRKEPKARLSGTFKGLVLPHYHLLAWGIEEEMEWREYHGTWIEVEQVGESWRVRTWFLVDGKRQFEDEMHSVDGRKDRFRHWLARMWYEFIGSGEIEHLRVHEHERTCQRVLFYRGLRSYVGKYVAKASEADGTEFCRGRWWGYWNAEKLPLSERISSITTKEVARVLARTAKRYAAKQRKALRVARALKKRAGEYVGRDPGQLHLGHSGISLFCEDPKQWQRLHEFYANEQRQHGIGLVHGMQPVDRRGSNRSRFERSG